MVEVGVSILFCQQDRAGERRKENLAGFVSGDAWSVSVWLLRSSDAADPTAHWSFVLRIISGSVLLSGEALLWEGA